METFLTVYPPNFMRCPVQEVLPTISYKNRHTKLPGRNQNIIDDLREENLPSQERRPYDTQFDGLASEVKV